MDAHAAQRLGEVGVVGEDRTAIAIAAERLGREEAGGGGKPAGAEPPSLVAGAKALGGVVEHEHALFSGDRGDRIVIGRLAEQIDRDHRLQLQAVSLGGGDAALQRLDIHVEGDFIDIDKHRRGAGERHHFAGGAEREGRADHRVARADALGHQHHQQRVGAAGAGHHMLGAAECRKISLELHDLRTVDEMTVLEHPADRLVDQVAETAALRDNINEGHGFDAELLIHVSSGDRGMGTPVRRYRR